MALTSELILLAAGYRTESRGAHQRSDYPHPGDEGWLCHVDLVADAQGAPSLSRRPVAS